MFCSNFREAFFKHAFAKDFSFDEAAGKAHAFLFSALVVSTVGFYLPYTGSDLSEYHWSLFQVRRGRHCRARCRCAECMMKVCLHRTTADLTNNLNNRPGPFSVRFAFGQFIKTQRDRERQRETETGRKRERERQREVAGMERDREMGEKEAAHTLHTLTTHTYPPCHRQTDTHTRTHTHTQPACLTQPPESAPLYCRDATSPNV